MGMYDSVYVDVCLLPEKERNMGIFNNDTEFQTKCFDCLMDSYYIQSSDNSLAVHDYYGLEIQGNIKYIFDTASGDLTFNFYTSIHDTWFEFIATFKNYKLVSIVRN